MTTPILVFSVLWGVLHFFPLVSSFIVTRSAHLQVMTRRPNDTAMTVLDMSSDPNPDFSAFYSANPSPSQEAVVPSPTHTLPTPQEDVVMDATYPTPQLDGVQVATLCMDALQEKTANEALEICFNFSSDRCRAAVGGTLEEFIRYADNPVFGTLVNCDGYEIMSVGPLIPGSSHGGMGSRRGEMQTVLVEITEGMTLKTVQQAVASRRRTRPTIEERLRRRKIAEGATTEDHHEYDSGDIVREFREDGKRRFLWTLQKERRPPRQNCWLVHEVLFTKNALSQTF